MSEYKKKERDFRQATSKTLTSMSEDLLKIQNEIIALGKKIDDAMKPKEPVSNMPKIIPDMINDKQTLREFITKMFGREYLEDYNESGSDVKMRGHEIGKKIAEYYYKQYRLIEGSSAKKHADAIEDFVNGVRYDFIVASSEPGALIDKLTWRRV